jgi:hypothetical protein
MTIQAGRRYCKAGDKLKGVISLSNADKDGHDPDDVVGLLKGAYNELAHLANAMNGLKHFILGTHIPKVSDLTPSNATQATSMQTGSHMVMAGTMIAGEGEAAGTLREIESLSTKADNILAKGLSSETMEAASREANGGMGIHKPGNTGELYNHQDAVRNGVLGINTNRKISSKDAEK